MFIFCYNLSFERKIFVYKLIIQFFNIYYDFGQKKRALAHQDAVEQFFSAKKMSIVWKNSAHFLRLQTISIWYHMNHICTIFLDRTTFRSFI
jgi:hypothetical protein